jgi:hypothetical protein
VPRPREKRGTESIGGKQDQQYGCERRNTKGRESDDAPEQYW